MDARHPSQTYAMTNQTISDQQLEARQGRKIDYYDYLKVHLRDSKDANFTKEFSLLLTVRPGLVMVPE